MSKLSKHTRALEAARRVLILCLLLAVAPTLRADDPGITKVRLIQESDTSFLFELDISAQFLWTIAPPIVPEHFRVSDPVYRNQSGWITVRARISGPEASFTPEDVLILPWERAGADVTVQWLDGSTFKGLFNRSLEGILIPMDQLMPLEKSTKEVLQEYFLLGIRHLGINGVHLLFVLALILAFPRTKAFRFLFLMSLGQLSSLLLAELDLPGFDLLFVDLLLVLLIFLLSISRVYRIRFSYLGPLLYFTGILHGLGFSMEIRDSSLEALQGIQALCAFAVATDLGHFLTGGLMLAFARILSKRWEKRKWPSVLTGSLAIFLMLLITGQHALQGRTAILFPAEEQSSYTYKSFAPQSGLSARQAQRGKGLMTTPIMVFLSIEDHEIRQEVLVQAQTAISGYFPEHIDDKSIPPEFQDQISKDLLQAVIDSGSVRANGKILEAVESSASFVTLGRGGVSIRETPVEEDIKEAIIGITLVYETASLPDSILLDWGIFPAGIQWVECSAVDPHGAFTSLLSPGSQTLKWENQLKGYQVPGIRPILVEPPAFPLLPLLLLLFLGSIFLRGLILGQKPRKQALVAGLLALNFLLYPFLRTQADLPLISSAKPSGEYAEGILGDLLSNTYRAFDRRNESDVYDLLSISVIGEQLSDIYLQNRQAMALENRGGARARVDEVSIGEVADIERLGEMDYVADTRWSVRGSVNHFGHTHYRKNQYRARVSFGIEGESWKIRDIEILDARRSY